MATPSAGFAVPLAEFAAALLSERELGPRTRLTAQYAAQLLADSAVLVYVIEDQESPEWKFKASEGDIDLDYRSIPFNSCTLGQLAEKKEARIFAADDLAREDYGHLNIKRSFASLAYLPLLLDEKLIGAVEIVAYGEPTPEASLAAVAELVDIAALGIATGLAYENERNTNLGSIARLTELYDLELVFNSTLEMDELMPLITSKIKGLASVQAVNLWLVEAQEDLLLVDRSGVDPTIKNGSTMASGGGIPADVADKGEPVLIDSVDDERLTARNGEATADEGAIHSLVAAPLVQGGMIVGVLEIINRMDGRAFDEDDLFLLTTVADAAAGSLHNASLLAAERKVEILETLVTISQEITSTLDLDRVLQTIVNAPQAVIPYERAVVALEQRGRFRLKAVTGVAQLNPEAPEIRPLNEILQWAALSEEIVDVRQRGENIDDPRDETRAKFKKYFSETGMRGFYAKPLNDDTGRVGILCMESSDPDFLTPVHREILQVLASQATVALRNAQMYKEVPFISVLEPILGKKRKFMALEKRRRTAIYTLVLAVAVFLVVCPFPMRVDGNAKVAPVHRAQVQPEVEGVVHQVYVHEGEHVARDQVLAEIGDWDYRSSLAAAEAKYQSALLQMNKSLAANDGSEAGIQRVQADYWKAEVSRASQLLDKTRLRSPIDGVVATTQVENFVGRRLQFGDSFAEVVDASRVIVDVAVDEDQASLLSAGLPAAINLNTYPTQPFHGNVIIVSPTGVVQGESRVFFARVAILNPDGLIRTGMEGRGKVRVGWRPVGYVMFRGPALWLYSKLWSWFGW